MTLSKKRVRLGLLPQEIEIGEVEKETEKEIVIEKFVKKIVKEIVKEIENGIENAKGLRNQNVIEGPEVGTEKMDNEKDRVQDPKREEEARREVVREASLLQQVTLSERSLPRIRTRVLHQEAQMSHLL